MTEQTTTDKPWMHAKPETFWLVNGDRIHDCIAHVLTPRPGDHGNPRFQLVMHDGSTHDDIYFGDELTDAHPLTLKAHP